MDPGPLGRSGAANSQLPNLQDVRCRKLRYDRWLAGGQWIRTLKLRFSLGRRKWVVGFQRASSLLPKNDVWLFSLTHNDGASMNPSRLLEDTHLLDELNGSKEYRHAYVDEFLNTFVAAQIKAMREQREWSQARLAQESGMKQSRISLLENVAYSSWNIKTLKKLAEAFDVALVVKFESFGQRLADIDEFSPATLRTAPFGDEFTFRPAPIQALQVAMEPAIWTTTALLPNLFPPRRDQRMIDNIPAGTLSNAHSRLQSLSEAA